MEVTINKSSAENFLKERNGIYEPDVKVWAPPEEGVANDSPKNELPVIGIAEIDENNRQYPSKRRFIVLLMLCALCAVLSAIFYKSIFTFNDPDSVGKYLKAHIDGDFFANASAAFMTAALWCSLTFLSGFFAFARPFAAAIPLLYSIGAGASFSQFTEAYGAGGAAAFAAFCLARIILTALVLCYVCVNSFEASSKLSAAIRGKDTRSLPTCFKRHTIKFIFALACSFVIGIGDAVLCMIFGNYFIL